jgi:hypothetical protein
MKIRTKIKRLRKTVTLTEAAAKKLGLPDFVASHARREIRALRHRRRRLAGGEEL